MASKIPIIKVTADDRSSISGEDDAPQILQYEFPTVTWDLSGKSD